MRPASATCHTSATRSHREIGAVRPRGETYGIDPAARLRPQHTRAAPAGRCSIPKIAMPRSAPPPVARTSTPLTSAKPASQPGRVETRNSGVTLSTISSSRSLFFFFLQIGKAAVAVGSDSRMTRATELIAATVSRVLADDRVRDSRRVCSA